MPYTIETEMYDNSFSEIQIMEFFEQHPHADDVLRILFFPYLLFHFLQHSME